MANNKNRAATFVARFTIKRSADCGKKYLKQIISQRNQFEIAQFSRLMKTVQKL